MNITRLSGKPLGQYQLQSLIAHDDIGALYHATLEHSRQEFTVRVMNLADADQMNRFSLFVELIAGIHHTNIAPIFHYAIESNLGYIVFDYFQGGTLQQRLNSATGPLPSPSEVNEVAQQIGDALQYAHDRGILHLHLKPDNVLFNHQGEAFVIDFGLLALKQYEGGSFEDDQRDFAQLVLTLLNGRAISANESAAWSAIPSVVQPILRKALNADPTLRYSSVKQLTFALGDALADDEDASGYFMRPLTKPVAATLQKLRSQTIEMIAAPAAPQSRRRWGVVGAVVAGLLLAIAAVAITTLNSSGDDVVTTRRPDNAATLSMRETQRAIAQATNQPMTIAALTATPKLPPTLTPLPSVAVSPTPFTFDPAQAVFHLPADSFVSIADEFDGDSLSSQNWYWWGQRPPVANGKLLFDSGDYQSGLMMRGLGADEGIIALFRYNGGKPELYLDNGDFDTAAYLRWSVVSNGGLWDVYSLEGFYPAGVLKLRETALYPDQWYYLIFKIEPEGRFSTYIWAQDNPSQYTLSISHAPDGDEWKNKIWQFVISGVNVSYQFERVVKLRFPTGYAFPNQPISFFTTGG